MPAKIAVVLNPVAGRGRGAQARELLKKRLPDARILQTSGEGEATALASQAATEGAEVVVAAGGDGTLGEVLNGIHGSGAKLGLLPLGTGNDFARHIGIGTDIGLAIDTLQNGSPRVIDVGKIESDGKSRLFINVAGAGFDSRCAQRTNDSRYHPILRHVKGMPAYLAAVAAEIMRLRASKMTLELDGKTVCTRAVLCAIANSQSYGGGMRVAPDALLDDGLFDICLIKNVSRLEFLRAFPGVFAGKHVDHPAVEMFRAQTITLQSEPALPVLVDGEVWGTTTVRFEMLPGSIEVVGPKL